jgi:uncharacterized membrane protein YfcA
MLTFYILAIIVVFLGVVIGLPGALHINPILLHFFEPHTVTFLTTVLLLMTSLSSIVIFWKHIQWRDGLYLSLYGALGGAIGGLLFGYLPPQLVVILFFASGFSFLWNHYHKKEQPLSRYGLFVSGFLTSFLQAFGISAGALRRAFLLSKGYSIQEIYGTIAVAYTVSSGGIVITRMVNEHIPFSLLHQILVLFPVIFITVVIGKKMMGLFSKKIQEFIVVYSLVVSLLLAIPYLFK